jgi:twitching motility protein PilU
MNFFLSLGNGERTMNLAGFLVDAAAKNASDLFISVDSPPMVNVEGRMTALNDQVIDEQTANALVRSILDEEQLKTYETNLELNLALQVPDAGRFRVNLFFQRGAPAAVCRFIKDKILSVAELGLPEKLNEIIMGQRGLVLVVGGTGTGKSTTLAAMIDYRARSQGGHILSIEDPIEFVHTHSKSLVNQREVGIDTLSYANALKNALREAPNVIMIGEVRDQNGMQQALTYAETGHLCVATLHANNANQALERIINFFPESAHAQILMDLSMHLNAIVSQRLCQGVDRKRVAVMELMFNTGHVSELIRQGKIGEIKEAMNRSEGMVHKTFDCALYELFEKGKISENEALRQADSRNNLSLKIRSNRHASGGLFSLEKELSFNRQAPFEQYLNFRLNPLQVSRKRREDAKEVLQNALITAFEEKGLTHSPELANIAVQYSFGVEDIKALSLEPIEHESDELSELTPDTDQKITLLINVIDTRFNSDVWRLQAKQRSAAGDPKLAQDEINALFHELLQDYPRLT